MEVWYREAAVFLARPADEGVPAGYVEEAERSDGTPMAARAPVRFADRPLGAFLGEAAFLPEQPVDGAQIPRDPGDPLGAIVDARECCGNG